MKVAKEDAVGEAKAERIQRIIDQVRRKEAVSLFGKKHDQLWEGSLLSQYPHAYNTPKASNTIGIEKKRSWWFRYNSGAWWKDGKAKTDFTILLPAPVYLRKTDTVVRAINEGWG